jgi:multidrug efflux system membrane fusion protein
VRPVKLGVAQGERQAIVSGLTIGDTVVTDGVDRLRDGAQVILPGAQPPAPGDAAGQRRHRRNQNGEGGQGDGRGQNSGNGDSSGGRKRPQ